MRNVLKYSIFFFKTAGCGCGCGSVAVIFSIPVLMFSTVPTTESGQSHDLNTDELVMIIYQ